MISASDSLYLHHRGSIGFGEAPLQSLLGQIGTNDVQDCIDALDKASTEGKAVLVIVASPQYLKSQPEARLYVSAGI